MAATLTDLPFEVATYNVLASAYVRPDRYRDVDAADLAPETRRRRLLERVSGLGASVICLQEVEPDAHTDIEGLLAPRFEGHYLQKGGDRPDGCSTFFDTRRFTRRSVSEICFSDGVDGPSSGHVALSLELEGDGRGVVITNTHLKWDPVGTPPAEQWAARQVQELLSIRQQQWPESSWIVVGDFNFEPGHDLLHTLGSHGLENPAFPKPRPTSVTNGRAKSIDYLLHTPDLVASMGLLPTLTDETVLPAPEEPSDHVPVVVEFEWRQGTKSGHHGGG